MRRDDLVHGLVELREAATRLEEALDGVPPGKAGALLLAETLLAADKASRILDNLVGKVRKLTSPAAKKDDR